MKKDKEIKLYEEPVIKVVKFTIELGFDGSFGGGSEGGEDGPDIEIPLGSNRSFSVDHSFQRSFDGSF